MLRRRHHKFLFNFGPCTFPSSSVRLNQSWYFSLYSISITRGISYRENIFCFMFCLLLRTNLLGLFQIQHLAFFLLLLVVPVVSFPVYYGPFYPPGRFWIIISQKHELLNFSSQSQNWSFGIIETQETADF